MTNAWDTHQQKSGNISQDCKLHTRYQILPSLSCIMSTGVALREACFAAFRVRTIKKRYSKSSLINGVSKTENGIDFLTAESDGHNRIDDPYIVMKPEFTDCFSNKVIAKKKINNGCRSTTYILARVCCTRACQRAYQHIRRSSFVDWARENTPCALHAKRVVFPLAPVDLVHQQRRHMSQTAAVQIRAAFLCASVLVEWCNRDCEESGKALVFVTITIRSHRHVVRPEVCTSG